MNISAITCPKCGAPSKLNQNDLLFMCETCETLHYVENNASQVVEYEVVKPDKETENTRYLPFWKLNSEFIVLSSEVSGFWTSRHNDKNRGKMEIFIPAWDLDPASFRSWAVNLTTKAWTYPMGGKIGRHHRVPATISKQQAYELADFVVVTIEAEKPGTLQDLRYNLKILGAEIVYIPQNL